MNYVHYYHIIILLSSLVGKLNQYFYDLSIPLNQVLRFPNYTSHLINHYINYLSLLFYIFY